MLCHKRMQDNVLVLWMSSIALPPALAIGLGVSCVHGGYCLHYQPPTMGGLSWCRSVVLGSVRPDNCMDSSDVAFKVGISRSYTMSLRACGHLYCRFTKHA